MLTKNVAVQVKAAGPNDDPALNEGQFIALASVFGNIDAVGDVVMPGAFTEDLKRWKDSGDTIPVYWGHRMDDPEFNIGSVVDATETKTGLEVKAQLDLDNPRSAQVYKLLKGRRVSRMSFAYDVLDGGGAERDGQAVYELRRLQLHEVSVVQVPANQEAAILAVKTANRPNTTPTAAPDAGTAGAGTAPAAQAAPPAGTDADPGEATKDAAALHDVVDRLAAVLGVKALLNALSTTDSSNDGTSASPAQPATAEEPAGAKADEPARSSPASLRLRTGLDFLAADVFSDAD